MGSGTGASRETAMTEDELQRAATRERYATFRNGPGVGSMLKEGRFSGEFALPESRVPSQILTSGAGAAERVRAYLAAGGSANEVADFAAFTIRQAAEGEDGRIGAHAYQNWTRRYGEALSAMPEVRARFDNLANATRALEEATERATRETQAFERSAASRFLGDADPVSAVGSLLRASDG